MAKQMIPADAVDAIRGLIETGQNTKADLGPARASAPPTS
jgi:hypothetical protein